MRLAHAFIIFWTLLCCTPVAAIASTSDPASFTVSVSPSPVHPGEVETVKVHAAIDSGWHLYGLVPTPAPGPSATFFTLSGPGATIDGTPTEDEVVDAYDPNFEKTVTYHEREATFYVPLRIDAPVGWTSLALTINYQTCNSSICLPPRTKGLTVPIEVVPGAVRAEYAKAVHAPTKTSNIAVFLLAAVAAGLLALITPCVFPLIPITLTSFVKQADGDRRRLVRLSLGYSLGIVLLYVAVGALTAILLGAGGVDKLAANPFVNFFAFAVFVLFAFSFFEIVEIQLPGDVGSLLITAKKQSGIVSLVLLGVVFVFASFTCTAPFIGTLLVAAAGGTLLKPLLGMLVFACAFVSPFVVFAFFPQWITKLPKSGIWLARVKATLGFIELAASLKFLSNVDLYYQWKLLTAPVILAAWALISVCAALYIFGALRFGITAQTEEPGARVSPIRWVVGSLFMLSAIYCFWGISGRQIVPIVATFLPPSGYGDVGTGGITGLPWLSDYSDALSSARSESKPLLIDFTGYTCTNCRLNEKQVFPAPAVQEELAKFVRVQLYTDAGPGSGENEKLQLSRFGDVALPLYGVVDSSTGDVIAKTAGVQSVQGFSAFLKSADTQTTAQSAAWMPFTQAALVSSTSTGKPAIIDFTAAWCTNCKAIEKDVFPSTLVASRLSHFSTFRSDLTNFSSPENAALERQFSITSLPAIVFIGKDGKEAAGTRISGLISVKDFNSRMEQVLGS